VPNLVCLATISILMAAKLEEALSPSFNRMISLLQKDQRDSANKPDLIKLETQIVLAFQVNFNFITVVPFLERFL
jgi:hypothetical protein